MSRRPVRTALLACLIAPFLAAPAAADPGVALDAAKAAAMVADMPMPKPPSYEGGTAIVNFVGPVTNNTMADLARTVQSAAIGGAERVRLNISSQGGSVAAVQFAVNILKTLPIPVETIAMSQIASAGVALYCAGETRAMADGATLYLHQQWSFREIQDKTAAAVVRDHRLSNRWYKTLIENCADRDADHAMLDYSARDVVLDADQAASLGMTTTALSELMEAKIWGTPINVVVPDSPLSPFSGGLPFPSR